MALHKSELGQSNHPVVANPNATGAPYADIAARDADTAFNTDSDNVDKIVKVTDADGLGTVGYFILVDTAPTWESFGGSLADTFLELTDTPGSFSGQGNSIVQVNSAGTALEFGQDLTPDSTAASFAVLDINSEGSGVSLLMSSQSGTIRLNRLTTTQRDAIAIPAAGMFLFNTTVGETQFYNGTAWVGDTGLDEFIELIDTPSNYSGEGGNIVQVNSGATGLEFGQDLNTSASPTFSAITVGSTGLTVGTSVPFSDSTGTLTLQNIDVLDATTETTIEAAIDTLANLTSIQGQAVTFSGFLIVEGNSRIDQDVTSDADVTFEMAILTGEKASVSLDLQSTEGAVLLNKLTTTERNLLTPQEGLFLYNETTKEPEFYNGTSWIGDIDTDTFIGLTDTPSSFSGEGGNVLQVNSGATAVEFGQDLNTTASPTFVAVTVGNTGLVVGTSTPFSDGAGSLTLQNVDVLDLATQNTIENALLTLPNVSAIQSQSVTFSGPLTVESASLINQDVTTDGTPTFGTVTVGNTGLVVGTSIPFSDSAGTLTLQNIDALDATTTATIDAAIGGSGNVTTSDTLTDTFFIMGNGGVDITASNTMFASSSRLTIENDSAAFSWIEATNNNDRINLSLPDRSLRNQTSTGDASFLFEGRPLDGTSDAIFNFTTVDSTGNTDVIITGTTPKLSLVKTGDLQFDIDTSGNIDMVFTKDSGVGVWDFSIRPTDGVSNSVYRFGQESGSTGTNQYLFIDRNSGDVQTRFSSSNIDSFINAFGGNLGIGGAVIGGIDTTLHVQSPGADTTAVLTTETIGTNLGEFKTFVGSRDPNGNVTGAGGDEYYRDEGDLSGSYESLAVTTDTVWYKRSLNPITTIEIINDTQLSEIATAGTITVDATTLVVLLKAEIVSDVIFNVINGGTLTIRGESFSRAFVSTASGTFITAVDSSIYIENTVFVSVTGVTTFINHTGEVVTDFLLNTVGLLGWDVGSVSRASTATNGPVADFRNVIIGNSIVGTSLVFTDSNFKSVGLVIGRDDGLTPTTPYFDIKMNNQIQGIVNITTSFGRLESGEALLRIDAGISAVDNELDILILGTSIVEEPTSLGIFDTSGSTGTFTTVANNSISATAITSVTDNGGVAVFNHAGSDPEVGQKVVISGFATETTYNDTGIVTATASGTFEIDFIAFTATDTGSFLSDSVTVTSNGHGLADGDGLVIDEDKSTTYDGSHSIFGVLTNTFNINVEFNGVGTGAWSTEGLDQTNPNVLAFNNPMFSDSKYIATAFVNDNSTDNGTIVNNTFRDMVFGTTGNALEVGSTMERWKLINEDTGIFEYQGIEDFDDAIQFDFTVESSGGTVDFRFKWLIDNGAGYVDLPDAVEVLVAVGSDAQSVTKKFPLFGQTGCRIKPQITRNSGSSDITTTYASIFAGA